MATDCHRTRPTSALPLPGMHTTACRVELSPPPPLSMALQLGYGSQQARAPLWACAGSTLHMNVLPHLKDHCPDFVHSRSETRNDSSRSETRNDHGICRRLSTRFHVNGPQTSVLTGLTALTDKCVSTCACVCACVRARVQITCKCRKCCKRHT